MLQGYQVKQLIEQQYPELTDKIYPSFSTTVEDISIIYFISTAAGGYVGQDTLEIRCIHPDYDTAESYKKKIVDIFSTEKENKAVVLPDIAFTGAVSGGGVMFNDAYQTWELTTFFVLKTKERN